MKSFTKEIEALRKIQAPEENTRRQDNEARICELQNKIQKDQAEIERLQLQAKRTFNAVKEHEYLEKAADLRAQRNAARNEIERLMDQQKDVYQTLKAERIDKLESELKEVRASLMELQASVPGHVEWLANNENYISLSARLFEIKDELSELRNERPTIEAKAEEIRRAMDADLAEEVLKAFDQLADNLKQYHAADNQIREILQAAGRPTKINPAIIGHFTVETAVENLINQTEFIRKMKEAAGQQ